MHTFVPKTIVTEVKDMKIVAKSAILATVLFLCVSLQGKAQFPFGTTGLMHLPTADMQRDGTAMIGGGYLNKHAVPGEWYYDTWNYYVNVTFLPFLEVAYDMTLFKGSHLFRKMNTPRRFYHRWANQDRNFSVRLRAVKEGQFWKWMPQIVLGANDVLHTFSSESTGNVGISSTGNGYWGRFYLAATKHFEFEGVGNLGVHLAGMYNKRKFFRYKGLGLGANFQLGLTDDAWYIDLLNGFNVMAEYDSRCVSAGLNYKIWNDHINLYSELRSMKYLSGGILFKIPLK